MHEIADVELSQKVMSKFISFLTIKGICNNRINRENTELSNMSKRYPQSEAFFVLFL